MVDDPVKHRMAEVLRVVRDGTNHAHLEIDGEPFPFFTVDGYTVHPVRGKPPHVLVSIAAHRVEVVDTDGTVTDDD